jgi:uncharacterized protein YyaL (SSP411 family)
VKVPAATFAADKGIPEEELENLLAGCRSRLLAYRSKRIRPQLDDKILLGWNALLNTAYSKAYAALGEESYRQKAIGNMHFLESRLAMADGSWRHTYKNGQARIPAFLDDYAYLVQSYIHLQEITGKGEYLLKARALAEFVIGQFSEEETGFFFYTHRDQSDIIVRKKEVYDGAVPSGNSVMAHNLLYLGVVFDRKEWTQRARELLASLGKAIVRYPTSFGIWALALQTVTEGLLEIAIVGQHAAKFLSPVLQSFIPNKILQAEETKVFDFPLLVGKEGGENGQPAFYLCKDYACQAPFSTVEKLLAIV